MEFATKRPFFLPLVLVFAMCLCAFLYWNNYVEDHYLKVAFLDVGQGDSIYIEAPNGNQVLIDGGRQNIVTTKLSAVMPRGDRTINAVIATHPDADHVGGLAAIFQKYTVGSFWEPGVYASTQTYDELEKTATLENAPHVLARAGTKLVLDKDRGVYLEILFPDAYVGNFETNDASIVARLVYGKTSILLTGDSPIATEDFLIARAADLDSDILKLGHHGSRTSTSAEYLASVTPSLAIISAGKGNSYGHPHQEVTDRLKDFHIPSLSTIDQGTIIIESDGVNYWQK